MGINPIQLYGNWQEGYAMDYHMAYSEYIGQDDYGHDRYDNTRTEIGEMVYQLKYQGDKSKVNDIINLIKPFLDEWNIKDKVDMVLPIPPSNLQRVFQPVFELTNGISQVLGLPTYNKLLVKNNNIQSKNLSSADKQKSINGSIQFTGSCKMKTRILLIDDLYQNGSTLNDTARALKTDPLVNNIYVLTMTKTKS